MGYREKYDEWLTSTYFDADTKAELKEIESNEKEIEDRFYKDLEFGTAGLRGVICAPSSQYTLYPLYSGGLWLAVILIPAIHPSFLTAKESSGVGLRLSNT